MTSYYDFRKDNRSGLYEGVRIEQDQAAHLRELVHSTAAISATWIAAYTESAYRAAGLSLFAAFPKAAFTEKVSVILVDAMANALAEINRLAQDQEPPTAGQ